MTTGIEVLGLGGGDINQLPLGIYRKLLKTNGTVYVRTMDHPVVRNLQDEGVKFVSFDYLYKQYDSFEKVYDEIARYLLEQSKVKTILYAVPGHPMLAEQTVQLLLEQKTIHVDIIGGQSYLDAMFTSLGIDPIEGFQFLDATSFRREDIAYQQHLIFSQVYDAYTASEVKLVLLEDLPPDYEITMITAAGSEDEKKCIIPLEELDRTMEVSNLTSVYVPPVPDNLLHHTFNRLREVVRVLRGPNGCPWDKKQTHESLKKYALEEVYELIDAIDVEDDEGIVEELGDVLLQVLLHSQIGEDEGYFTINEVMEKVTNKMIHRHPHVFGGGSPDKSWDELKREEKPEVKQNNYLLDDVIMSAPALEAAQKLQHKAAKVGFDWDNVKDIWKKLEEEKGEFLEAVEGNDRQEMENEFGDILFVLANIARFYQIQSELSLHKTNKKFYSRFTYVEKELKNAGNTLEGASFQEMDHLWNMAKERK